MSKEERETAGASKRRGVARFRKCELGEEGYYDNGRECSSPPSHFSLLNTRLPSPRFLLSKFISLQVASPFFPLSPPPPRSFPCCLSPAPLPPDAVARQLCSIDLEEHDDKLT
ncbi:unnamed protein product [Pleuronectes platessa]|uniref:Uncharacterized protein n=1 Tax=Pleuronectes platessa TaxID=8262 RepID=A0A9N7V010_PLEPL|nr:unnamed protein product [Pleuronectes platessa]